MGRHKKNILDIKAKSVKRREYRSLKINEQKLNNKLKEESSVEKPLETEDMSVDSNEWNDNDIEFDNHELTVPVESES